MADGNLIIRRKSFSKLPKVLDLPNLLEVQLESYNTFLQGDIPPLKRKNQGLQAVFNSVFPITEVHGKYSLEFVSYSIGEPKYSVEECQDRDMTYSAPLKATLRLIIWDYIGEKKRVKDIIEQEVYLGELPLITHKGTFIINGAERVIVNQLHRAPGVVFSEEVHPNGKRLYSARIIPHKGSWIEFSIDVNDVMFINIDRRRKIPVTILLRALGYGTNQDIVNLFYDIEEIDLEDKTRKRTGLTGRVIAERIVDHKTGEIIVEKNDKITPQLITKLKQMNIRSIKLYGSEPFANIEVIHNTLSKDPTNTEADALVSIYNLLRPGELPDVETARLLLEKLFFSPKRYDLGEVGRYKLNQRLHLDFPLNDTVLHVKDFIAIIRYLITLWNEQGYVDDIDHLGNRRIRSVGELLTNQLYVGLSRMVRTVRERMSLQDSTNITPYDLVNVRTLSAVIAAFFGSSQLSQFMDQVNPLSELTHKRRLSALGPGGLSRERAGFEVRDVHHSHYGRMCPIETPEGPNIGLISSLCTYARINRLGFIETPYRKVKDGVVTDEIEYLLADKEDQYTIAQANAPLDKKGRFVTELIQARKSGNFVLASPKDIEYMDVSPMQLVSVAAALIPFLEHDDANRALMGSNMQRQAVPLLNPEPAIVGTGIEHRVAVDSGSVVVARRSGTVIEMSADTIVIKPDEKIVSDEFQLENYDIYQLTKFKRSNQDTCIHERPIVREGDKVTKGQVIADGPAISQGELAMGVNVMVAFLPWSGYNFEDAIVVSERLLKSDKFSSVHIEEFELEVRDTKRGTEEITREIPNVSEDMLKNLDEDGIIRIGAEVYADDILVGKVTPKGETELSPEERLLRAIFGEKAGDVRDASLRAPAGMHGVVVDVKVFSRKDRDERTKREEKKKITKLRKQAKEKIVQLKETRDTHLKNLLLGETAQEIRKQGAGELLLHENRKITQRILNQLDFDELEITGNWVKSAAVNKRIAQLLEITNNKIESIERELEKEIEKISRGDELPPGVVKLVKVYIARKRKLSVGDKLAGRHGNKGVVAKIVPEEDMPYLPDGTPIDVLLNPLGVPSRMNVGQILETHLGWAAKELGIYVASPVFDGATLEEIRALLKKANLSTSGKTVLYDGRTGEPFQHEVTVGYMYIMKLSHLVDDKIHARSIGPYSLITQQPLGGKAQFGGQRFGEMEVWALEAYGAAYALQELLTVKSDDVVGRSRIYEAIVKGENPTEPGVPESFNVLIKELQSLGLDVQLEESET